MKIQVNIWLHNDEEWRAIVEVGEDRTELSARKVSGSLRHFFEECAIAVVSLKEKL